MIIKRTLAGIAIAVLLTGCQTQPTKVITVVEYVVVKPQSSYLKPTTVPQAPKPTNQSTVDWKKQYIDQSMLVVDLYAALGACNADKIAASKDIAKKEQAYAKR